MIVYKGFFKIVKRHLPLLLMYIGIFTGIAWLNIISMTEKEEDNYKSTQIKLAIINYDIDGAISKDLSGYIGEENKVVDVEDDREAMQEALFYRAAEYILIIPKDFTKDFLEGKDVKIERMRVPDSYSSYYIDSMVDKYLNMANLYNIGVDSNVSDIITQIRKGLEVKTDVQMAEGVQVEKGEIVSSVVNFTSYVISAITILFIGITIGAFNQKDIKRRNNVSPVTARQFAVTQIVCNGLLVLGIVLINFTIVAIMCKDEILTLNGFIMLINMILCGLVALSFGFLFANIIKSKNGQMAAANTVSLGLSFITGVFVPLEFLDKSVVTVARFTPTYWFVQVNEKVAGMTDITFSKLIEVFQWMGIQLLFAVAIFTIGIAVSRQKALGGKE